LSITIKARINTKEKTEIYYFDGKYNYFVTPNKNGAYIFEGKRLHSTLSFSEEMMNHELEFVVWYYNNQICSSRNRRSEKYED